MFPSLELNLIKEQAGDRGNTFSPVPYLFPSLEPNLIEEQAGDGGNTFSSVPYLFPCLEWNPILECSFNRITTRISKYKLLRYRTYQLFQSSCRWLM